MIASISIIAPLGRLETPTTARAGYGSEKYSVIISFTNGKSDQFVR